jgi:hypothetical protein
MPGAALEGTQPGITWEDIKGIVTEEFGFRDTNTRFVTLALRQYNRALLDIWKHFPTIRRFTVHDAEVTIKEGVDVYDVRATAENGGWGWTRCVEVMNVIIPDIYNLGLETMSLEQYRPRQDLLIEAGRPEGVVLIDNYNVRIVPTPEADHTGTGDYRTDVPWITTGKPDWPAGWDQVALIGCEFYLSKSHRPRSKLVTQDEYEHQLNLLRRGEFAPREKPDRAISTRSIRQRRLIPHDNSTDVRRWR